MKHDAVIPEFKEHINELQGNMTQQAFADLFGYNRSTMKGYLNGFSIPSIDLLKEICIRFNVSSDWLLGLTECKTINVNERGAAEYTGLSDSAVAWIYQLNKSNGDIIKTFSNMIEKYPGVFYSMLYYVNRAISFQESKINRAPADIIAEQLKDSDIVQSSNGANYGEIAAALLSNMERNGFEILTDCEMVNYYEQEACAMLRAIMDGFRSEKIKASIKEELKAMTE